MKIKVRHHCALSEQAMRQAIIGVLSGYGIDITQAKFTFNSTKDKQKFFWINLVPSKKSGFISLAQRIGAKCEEIAIRIGNQCGAVQTSFWIKYDNIELAGHFEPVSYNEPNFIPIAATPRRGTQTSSRIVILRPSHNTNVQ